MLKKKYRKTIFCTPRSNWSLGISGSLTKNVKFGENGPVFSLRFFWSDSNWLRRIEYFFCQPKLTPHYWVFWPDLALSFFAAALEFFENAPKKPVLTCPLISQCIAHFRSICPFLCTASFTIPIIIQVRAAAKHTLPLLPLLPSFSSFPSVSEQNGGPKKALNPQNRGTEGV